MTTDESVAGLKELLLTKIQAVADQLEERDTLYTDRDLSRQKAIEAAFAASEKATSKSDQNAEKWRENANEWRSAMQDREIRFASRVEVDNELKNLRTELASVKEQQDTGKGKGEGLSTSWGIVLGSAAILATLMAVGQFARPTPTPVAPTPQVIYVPAPAGALLPTTPPQPAPR